MNGESTKGPFDGGGSQVLLSRALYGPLELAACFFVPVVVILGYVLVTHRDLERFFLGFVAGPVWIGILVGALFVIPARRSFRRNPPSKAPLYARRRSDAGKLLVILIGAFAIAGGAVYQLSHLHPSQSTPSVAVSAGIACGGFFGLGLGVGVYAAWLRRKERQVKGELWVAGGLKPQSKGLRLGQHAFYVLDAQQEPR